MSLFKTSFENFLSMQSSAKLLKMLQESLLAMMLLRTRIAVLDANLLETYSGQAMLHYHHRIQKCFASCNFQKTSYHLKALLDDLIMQRY